MHLRTRNHRVIVCFFRETEDLLLYVRCIAHAYSFNAQKMIHCSFQFSQQGELTQQYFKQIETQRHNVLFIPFLFWFLKDNINKHRFSFAFPNLINSVIKGQHNPSLSIVIMLTDKFDSFTVQQLLYVLLCFGFIKYTSLVSNCFFSKT